MNSSPETESARNRHQDAAEVDRTSLKVGRRRDQRGNGQKIPKPGQHDDVRDADEEHTDHPAEVRGFAGSRVRWFGVRWCEVRWCEVRGALDRARYQNDREHREHRCISLRQTLRTDRIGQVTLRNRDCQRVVDSRKGKRRAAEDEVAVSHRITPDSFRNAAVSLPNWFMNATYSSCAMNPG